MRKLNVALGDRSYPILIGGGLIDRGDLIAAALKTPKIAVVTNDVVATIYLERLLHALSAQGIACSSIVLPDGEAHKNWQTLQRIFDGLLENHCDRSATIVALGGGVVGDLAGYLAATLLRGIRYVQVPTSLLAMVDSSVGGKTAINHASGKNLIGAFHQPAAVFCDLHFLKTLPLREYVSALAEVVKTAAIAGEEMLADLEASAGSLLERDLEALHRVIETCVRFKAEVVAEDETETTGRRATLNFGHTVAHVLETLWPERWLHGEAVAIGIAAALRLSVERAKLHQPVAQRVVTLLETFGLPVSLPAEMDSGRMLEVMAGDKKRAGHAVHFVVISEIGEAGTLPCRLDEALVETLLGRQDA